MDEDQDQKSIQLRALVAFALSAIVLFAYQYFVVKNAPPKPPAPAAAETKSAPPSPAPAAAPAAKKEARKPAATAAPVEAAPAEQTFVIETDTYLVALSNRGAVATSWTLKKYKDESGKPLELVNVSAAGQAGYPFSYGAQADSSAGLDIAGLNQSLFRVETPPGRLAAPITLTFQWSDGNLRARKSFHFEKNSYVVDVQSDLTQNGTPAPHWLAWRGGFGDAAVEDAAKTVKTFYFDTTAGKVIWHEAKDAEKGPVVNSGNYLFAGVEDHYFAAAFLQNSPGVPLQLETSALETANGREQKKQLFAGAAVGGAGDNRFLAYVGPKSLETLRSVRPQLAQLVDFGFFSFIAYPLFLMLTWTHRWLPNFGWAIVAVTVVINFILFPLKLKSMTSMKKMQKLQPLIKHINDKYKNLPMRDPKRQEQNKEVMELYGKYGVNPLGGCLPMLLQLPFFFAFYAVLNSSIEMRRAGWLWVSDLSTWDHIFILPIAMIATQFWFQKMTPSTSTDPAQQKMMQFMPLIMGFFFYRLPSGLVLYWLTGNLVGILQQWFINRLPEADLEIEKPKKGKSKRA
ncbi:MAG: membrane protein insertase YidC [Acidobacteria bacterium]|nr:membrane protein insertase YidC [Acidobacteriota bacterium]